MKTKEEIVRDWLPRYTGRKLEEFGQNVLLVMDSVTRYAHACREVALSAGEPPVARGYPP